MTTTNKTTTQDLTPATTKQEIDRSQGELTFEGRYFGFAADILENEEAVTVIADLPGVSAHTLDVDLRDSVLTIMARVEDVPGEWRLIHGEYEMGGYMRQFNVGPAIDRDKISASMKDGVLTLVMAKADRLKPRKVEVRVG
ncbi:MAG: Hsp20/alpha crystallin family protein [Pseudomonadota bacterium]